MTEILNPSTLGGPEDYPERLRVLDDLVDWNVANGWYLPPYYTSDHVLGKAEIGEADPEHMVFSGHIMPSVTEFATGADDRPLNPLGRTGIAGRGRLYFWGPNHTADTILTRGSGEGLEVVLGRRKDNGRLALPGGFLNIGELAIRAALRELWEETGIDLRHSTPEPAMLLIGRYLVHNSTRMTDNAWIETNVFHISAEQAHVAHVTPVAGDDLMPGTAKWRRLVDIDLDSLHDDHPKYIRDFLAISHLVDSSPSRP